MTTFTTHITLDDDLKAFVDRDSQTSGFASISEYIRNLMDERRKHKEAYELAKSHMRGLMLEGINSGVSPINNHDYLVSLRNRIPQLSTL
jgi:Arc/MetJ-type ribon-helix-helix transcriptional regulator